MCGQGRQGAEVEGQIVVVQRAAVAELQLLAGAVQSRGLADQQFNAGSAAQGIQFDTALGQLITATEQARQHARIPGMAIGAEQADATRRAVVPGRRLGPAAQHTEMGVTGAGQQQVKACAHRKRQACRRCTSRNRPCGAWARFHSPAAYLLVSLRVG